jgi:hypothetical protein
MIERIFVSWTQQWDLATYIDHYLRTRRIAVTDASRERVWRCIGAFQGPPPYRKSDLDFFLDANLNREPAPA